MRTAVDILGAMTLEEKAALITGDSAWTTTAIPRVGLPSLRMADGPHGVRRTGATDSMAFAASPATCFATACCTASTWNPDLLREMGRAIAGEAIALDVDVVLGPASTSNARRCVAATSSTSPRTRSWPDDSLRPGSMACSPLGSARH